MSEQAASGPVGADLPIRQRGMAVPAFHVTGFRVQEISVDAPANVAKVETGSSTSRGGTPRGCK
jgi:hypothetical protein